MRRHSSFTSVLEVEAEQELENGCETTMDVVVKDSISSGGMKTLSVAGLR